MNIPVLFPLRNNIEWAYHFAAQDGSPLCGAAIQSSDWDVGAVGFIVDEMLCTECLDLRKMNPSLQNVPEERDMKCIYIIRLLGTSYYKIGITTNLGKRLVALQRSNPIPLMVVWHSDYCDPSIAHRAERLAHNDVQQSRVKQTHHREWFSLTKQDIGRLKETIRGDVQDGGLSGR